MTDHRQYRSGRTPAHGAPAYVQAAAVRAFILWNARRFIRGMETGPALLCVLLSLAVLLFSRLG
jgi:hypothetical protein